MKIKLLLSAFTFLFVSMQQAAEHPAAEHQIRLLHNTGRLAELELRALFRERADDLHKHGYMTDGTHAAVVHAIQEHSIISIDKIFDHIREAHRQYFPEQYPAENAAE